MTNESQQGINTPSPSPTPSSSTIPSQVASQGSFSITKNENPPNEKVLYELYEKIKAVEKNLEDKKGDITDTKNVAMVGFVILLVTAGMYFSQSMYEKKSSYDALVEKVYSLQEKVDSLKTQLLLQERDNRY